MTKKCPNCTEEMDDDLVEQGICSECGEEFDAVEEKEDEDKISEED